MNLPETTPAPNTPQRVLVNATPIIALSLIGQLNLL
jgi:hypothetical protein